MSNIRLTPQDVLWLKKTIDAIPTPAQGRYFNGARLAAEVEDRWKARDRMAWRQSVAFAEQIAEARRAANFWQGLSMALAALCLSLGIAVAHLLSSSGS